MSDALAIATMESFLIEHDDRDYKIAIESAKVGLTDSELRHVNRYQQLVTFENRIMNNGIGMNDVAALETIAPGTLSNAMPIDGFSYKPSMRNVEYALERINLAKITALAAAGAIIVKYAKAVIDYVKRRIQDFRDKRAAKAADKLNESLKAYRNNKDQKDKQNGLSKNTTEIPRPGGASHNSQVKAPATNPQVNMYKDIWVGKFGLKEGDYSSYASCTSVKELCQFLMRTSLQGPAIFLNDPNVDIDKMLKFIENVTLSMDKINDQQKLILRNIDGAMAGNATDLDLSFESIIGPLSIMTSSTSRDIKEQVDTTATIMHRWTRTTSIANSLLLARSDIIPKVLMDLVNNFNGEQIINTMTKYTREYDDTVQAIQVKIEKYLKSAPQSQGSEALVRQVNQYNDTMRQLIALFRQAVMTYGNVTDYLTSFASALNLFMEN